MAGLGRQMSYGDVTIFDSRPSDLLGRGSYGKVCKAKCGQLPCAAKLPHDIILDSDDPDIQKYVEQFEQECQFLKVIKHPNIVQFLGTYKDPRSQRLALLMELMDESLTRFLKRFTDPLPYHTQLNICQDVALALAYLHSNDIIHRDLSSNNVLLIGEGSRAKVTDFGMSKLFNNPYNTQLTKCPGNSNYMPPEAVVSPPQYSTKLDCFSHGVLTIQIVTRQFPNPGDATTTIDDARFPTGRVSVFVPETDRRKKDIDLVAPDHPLLPLALHCLKDRDTERPSADELCGRLATLKCEPRYTHSVDQSRKQKMSLQTLQQKDSRGGQERESELERVWSNSSSELSQFHATFQQQLQEREDELAKAKEQYEKELNAKETMLEQIIAENHELQAEIEQLHEVNQQKQEHAKVTPTESKQQSDDTASQKAAGQTKLTWRQGTPAPNPMTSYFGASVVHEKTAYFSLDYNVYCYKLPEDRWTTLPPCEYTAFSLAIIKDKLTTIGGRRGVTTNELRSCTSKKKWEQPLPPMPTARQRPAAATVPTHLVVAGGQSANNDRLSTVEVLDLNTLQWFSASSSPKVLLCPHMTLCGGYLYLSKHNTIFSCSVEELLKSCKPPSTHISDGGSVWTSLADIPVLRGSSLATLRGHVLAIGGKERYGNPKGTIYCYDRSTNSWSPIGEMPTPRSRALVAVLPSNELIVVGGKKSFLENYNTIEIGFTD